MYRSAMQELRAHDPALKADVDGLCPSLDEVFAAVAADEAATGQPGRSRTRRRHGRILVAAGVAAAAAVTIGVVNWPGQPAGPVAAAYGVTVRGDGLVDVRLPWDRPYTPATLQAKLRAAGVRTVVLMEQPRGQCHEPNQDGIPSDKFLILPRIPGRDPSFTIRPGAMAADVTLVIVLHFPGEVDDGGNNLGTLYFTDQAPATCVPQSIFQAPPNSRPS